MSLGCCVGTLAVRHVTKFRTDAGWMIVVQSSVGNDKSLGDKPLSVVTSSSKEAKISLSVMFLLSTTSVVKSSTCSSVS